MEVVSLRYVVLYLDRIEFLRAEAEGFFMWPYMIKHGNKHAEWYIFQKMFFI